MPIQIHIVIDQYLHRWDTPQGELWFCVRAFVGSAADALAWAKKPDVMDQGLYDITFMRSDAACPTDMIPINLPTSVDIWHNVPDLAGKPRWTRYRRSVSCRDKQGNPFPVLFNQKIRDRTVDAVKDGADALKAALELMFLTGSRETLADFSDTYRTNGKANPALLLDGGTTMTSMFWLLGLMHRIGGKDQLAALQGLKHYDVVLSWDTGAIDETAPVFDPKLSASLNLPTAEATTVGAAERAFFAPDDPADIVGHWLPALTASAMSAELNGTIDEPDAPDWLFVKPVRRNLEASTAPGGLPLFKLSTADKQVATPDGAIERRDFKPVIDTSTLLAIEIEAEAETTTPPPAPADTMLQPGIALSGRLRPYRRFPLQPAPAGSPADANRVRLPTVMAFEPDPDCAAELAMLLAEPGAEATLAAALAQAVATETVSDNTAADRTDWSVELLSIADLPWDDPANRAATAQIKPLARNDAVASARNARGGARTGGGRQLRVLATPTMPAARAELGEPRVLVNATLNLFVKRGAPIALALTTRFETIKITPGKPDVSYWHSVQLGRPAAGLPRFNALAAVDAASLASAPKVRVTAVFKSDYEFERALSTTNLEGVVRITTATPATVDQAAIGFSAGAPSPFRTHAEERANFNTLHQVDEAGNSRDNFTQISRPSTTNATPALCDNALLGITQIMPFAKTWPESARDNRQANNNEIKATPKGWEAVRDHVRLIYRVDPADPAAPSLDLALRHTFGELLPVRRPSMPVQLAWPVELATSAEQRQPTDDRRVRDERPFMRVDYTAGGATATFVIDPAVLEFDAPPPVPPEGATETDVKRDERRKADQACNAGTLAWRALAEILDPNATAQIAVRPVEYDLFERDGANANKLASSWRTALRDREPVVISTTAFTQALRDHAKQWFAAKSPSKIGFSFTVKVPDLAAANIARFELTVVRAAARTSDAAVLQPLSKRLRTDTAVPTDSYYRAYADTLEGSWAAAYPANWTPEAAALAAATVWRDPRRTMTDSITPQDPPAFDNKAFADTVRGLREGTDWFPPPGTIDYGTTTVTPVLIPCGFASPAEHPDLAVLTEPALVALLASLQDYYDLAFEAGTVDPAQLNGTATRWGPSDWKATFAIIDASVDGLAALTARLCDILLWAQPGASGVTASVAKRVTQLNDQDRTNARALLDKSAALLANRPALYASSKALLVTELKSAGPRDLAYVAGARFQRVTQPWTIAAPSPLPVPLPVPMPPPPPLTTVTTSLDLPQLIALDRLGGGTVTGGIAFVELLDDVTYDNAFDVADRIDGEDGQRIEPFEAIVDPKAFDNTSKLWTTALPETPLAAENGSKSGRRRVHLASRRPVTPPILVGAFGLGTATVGGLPANATYILAELLANQPPNPAGRLIVAATRAAPGAPILFQDELFRLIYVIRGDEEGDTASRALFVNDLFSLEAPAQRIARSATTPDPMSIALRSLVSEPARSRSARDAVAALAPSLGKVATTYVVPPAAAPPSPPLGFGIQPSGNGWAIEPLKNGKTELWPEWLRNVSVLKTTDAATQRAEAGGPGLGTAILVLDMVTSVWRDAQFALRQTRNATLPGGFSFADQFRSSASQRTPPAVHRVTKRSVNPAVYWNKAGRPKRPATITIDALLTAVAKMKMAPQPGGPSPSVELFDPAAAKASGYRLTVTLYQEQFLRPVRAGIVPPDPAGRLLVAAYHATMGTPEINTQIVFPPEVRTFSLDLQWTTPSGEAALRLERLFLEA